MARRSDERHILWKIILTRLLIATILLSFSSLLLGDEATTHYFLIAGIYLLSVCYMVALRCDKAYKYLRLFQVLGDLVIATSLIQVSGAGESPLVLLYLFIILESGILLDPASAIGAGVLVSLFYFELSWMSIFPSGILPILQGKQSISQLDIPLLYRVYVHAVSFCLFGVLLYGLMDRFNRLKRHAEMQSHLALIGDVSSQIAHEIRNPLAAIAGAGELLQESLASELKTQDKKLLEALVLESHRAGEILQTFLDYAKWEQIAIDKISLNKLLDDVLTLFANTRLTKVPVKILRSYPHEIFIEGDRNRLKQVVVNIVKNALESMQEAGTLEVSTLLQGKCVLIDFRDNGIGMRLQKRSSSSKLSPSASPRGMGLGLKISENIVKLHGGKVEVDSQVGKGTSVKILLPLRQVS